MKRGTNAASVGHKIGFGNTEEEARIANLGCKARARPGDGPFDHNTGDGPFDHNKSGRPDRGHGVASFELIGKKKKNFFQSLFLPSCGGGPAPVSTP